MTGKGTERILGEPPPSTGLLIEAQRVLGEYAEGRAERVLLAEVTARSKQPREAQGYSASTPRGTTKRLGRERHKIDILQ